MNLPAFLALLDELLELPAGTLKPGDRVEEFGWSSVASVGFMALADDHFDFVPNPRRLAKVETVQDLIDIVSDETGAKLAA